MTQKGQIARSMAGGMAGGGYRSNAMEVLARETAEARANLARARTHGAGTGSGN